MKSESKSVNKILAALKMTIGPWYATGAHVQSVTLDEDNYVCKAEGRTSLEIVSNAQIIAAAPDMLRVLLEMKELLEIGDPQSIANHLVSVIQPVIDRAVFVKSSYELRVEQLEAEGMTTSDAQSLADVEERAGSLDSNCENLLSRKCL